MMMIQLSKITLMILTVTLMHINNKLIAMMTLISSRQQVLVNQLLKTPSKISSSQMASIATPQYHCRINKHSQFRDSVQDPK
jgi:hypothetical protein